MDPRMNPGVMYRSLSIAPASVATITVAEQTFTVPNVPADHVVYGYQNPAIANAVGIAGVRVSAANTVAIRFVNPTAGALTPTAGVWHFFFCKPAS